AQLRMLDILIAFDNVCQKHDIPYWISSGTFLGAVRHRGFIPWDDDIDVEFLQTDYKRLIAALEADLPPEYKLQTRKTDKNYLFDFPKIRDTKSNFTEDQNEIHHYKYNGIYIDLFPFEPFFSLKMKSRFDRIRIRFTNRKFSKNFVGRCCNTAMGLLLPLYYARMYSVRFLGKLLKVKNYTYGPGIFFYVTENIDDIFPLKKIEFEGRQFSCPGNADAYLTKIYGNNYMTPPPPEGRAIHASKIEFF
ncbi:MAG: LicD family protein, partial [Dysgonamonadaceae bacterium]|nr:LicD family protein [Dysgonamonadaceae bacterium]